MTQSQISLWKRKTFIWCQERMANSKIRNRARPKYWKRIARIYSTKTTEGWITRLFFPLCMETYCRITHVLFLNCVIDMIVIKVLNFNTLPSSTILMEPRLCSCLGAWTPITSTFYRFGNCFKWGISMLILALWKSMHKTLPYLWRRYSKTIGMYPNSWRTKIMSRSM